MDIENEIKQRVSFIKKVVEQSGADGIVYGNSGGKDSAVVGILCKKAINNVLGVIMPCGVSINYTQDRQDAIAVAEKFNIDYITVDITGVKEELVNSIEKSVNLNSSAVSNIAPRIRMATLYAIAKEKNYIVAGTGNRSENYMGYFTKWGDGAFDFNPIGDMTVTEIYEMLKYLKAPETIIGKPPSGGLYEGQTDEKEMGVKYSDIDKFLLTGEADEFTLNMIQKAHKSTMHKRSEPVVYKRQ